MSSGERRDEQSLESSNTPVDGAQSTPRRRFIVKTGASVVPVVLTLASRPVLAWHCKAPSAWGSELLNPNTSLAAGHTSLADESWTISEWVGNLAHTGLGQPWVALGCNVSNTGAANYYKKYLISTLFTGLTTPGGLNGNTKVWACLNDAAVTTFTKSMIVARLNYKLIANIQTCLTAGGVDQLNLMVGGNYSPPHLTATVWNSTQILSYLNGNYVVLP